MAEKADTKKTTGKKSFLKKVIEKLDKKMQEKAKSNRCCCGPADKDNPCCS